MCDQGNIGIFNWRKESRLEMKSSQNATDKSSENNSIAGLSRWKKSGVDMKWIKNQ